MDLYLEKKSKGKIMSNVDMKEEWKKFRSEGKEHGKAAREEVKAEKNVFSSFNDQPK